MSSNFFTMSKRKCIFRDEFSAQFPGIKKSRKGESYAFCEPCHSELNISCGGISFLKKHVESAGHVSQLKEKNTHHSIFTFLRGESPDDLKAAAAEGCLAFHAVKHHYSFLSSDCTTRLIRSLFPDSKIAKKLNCGRTKMEAIIKGVLAPESIKDILLSLGNAPYSIATDASNHHEIKTFPVIIRFFGHNGLNIKLLEFADLPGETSDIIATYLADTITKNGLQPSNFVAYSADNANVNFGGKNLSGSQNVFSKLKLRFNNNLIPVGCPAHIIHNAAKHGGECFSCDAEAMIFKIASHFCSSTSRHEVLKEFCEFVEVNYACLPTHSPTRWLSLLPMIERMLKLWPALKSYFLSIDSSPKILKKFFENKESEVYFLFLQSSLPLFQQAILMLEKSDIILPEMLETIKQLLQKLLQRKQSDFFGVMTTNYLSKLDDISKQVKLRNEFIQFYKVALDYIETWFQPQRFPSCTDWLCLKTSSVSYADVYKSAETLLPDLVTKDSLFDEVTLLNSMLKVCFSDGDFSPLPIDQKWTILLKNESLIYLGKVVSTLFAIPTSNACVERIFSLMKIQWSDDRNRLQVGTMKAILQILTNYNLTCEEMHQKLLNDERLTRLILSAAKYC